MRKCAVCLGQPCGLVLCKPCGASLDTMLVGEPPTGALHTHAAIIEWAAKRARYYARKHLEEES
jgi:hypothetical protein